jgi:hypothetical protein
MRALRFLWWNVETFAHYDPILRGKRRPQWKAAYDAKLELVVRVMHQLFGEDRPEVVVLGEATRRAAEDLRSAWAPDYNVFSLDLDPVRPELAVAFLYNPAIGMFDEDQIVAPRMSTRIRDMGVLDYCFPGHRIRLIACHWPSRMDDGSKRSRIVLAEYLNDQVYRFLQAPTPNEANHVVILGDLNEEPYGVLEEHLFATRDRAASRDPIHYQDRAIGRAWLYNCSWRFVGECFPHMGSPAHGETAGTYYWGKRNTWHTFDHVIVTGSLLSAALPFLDESSVRVVVHPLLLNGDGKPRKFSWANGVVRIRAKISYRM